MSRIRAEEVAALTGLSVRRVQQLAAAGSAFLPREIA